MRVQQATWRSGELEIIVVDEDGRAISIAHTLSHHLSILAGYEKAGRIVSLWEIQCLEPRGCYLCVRLLDPSVCVDVGDSNTVKAVLKKVLRQLNEIEVDVVVRKVLEKAKEYMEEVVKDS